MGEQINIEVSNEVVAREVAYAILGRAQDIHSNPDDEYEHIALELREVGNDILSEDREKPSFEAQTAFKGGPDRQS